MPVGKGSLTRAAKVSESTGRTPKKTQAPIKKAAVPVKISGGTEDIHEKKFESISKIACDLPVYLL